MGSSRKRVRGDALEWVGGRALAPVWVGTDEPRRPEIVLWVELPSELVVGCTLSDPAGEPVPFARTLREAMARPKAGPARRPDRVRVAGHDLAAELRAELGDELPVEVAPTPEFDRVLADFARFFGREGDEPSYLEKGAVSPKAVAELFADAAALWSVAPWKAASDDQVLRVDIPALGVDGACVSIIGALGQSIGILIFPSLEGFEALAAAADERMEQPPARGSPFWNFGTSLLSLTFERGAELPRSLRREVSSHGWRVASPEAYPRVEHRDPDGVLRVLRERDVAIASACAGALAAFVARHREFFADDAAEPVCESYTGGDGVRVRVSAPYEAAEWFEEEPEPDPTPRRRAVGRNEPCPCGSGKKYKKCHLPLEEAARAPAARPADLHALDGRVVGHLLRFAVQRLPREFAAFREDFEDAEASWQLAQHWAAWHFCFAGKSVAEHFLSERASRLSPEERAWIESQRESWLSIWQVTAVDPGVGLDLLDLLSGEKRHVREVAGSHGRALRDALLARVVDHGGVSLLCGMHPRPLPPREAAAVVGAVRARLRRRGAVPIERLREEGVGRHLISRWEQEVAALLERHAQRPELVNTEGDPILLTVDQFELDPSARAEVGERLASLPDVDARPPASREREYVFLRPQKPGSGPGQTVWGRAVLGARGLRLETNSIRRADELREKVESAAGALVAHRARTHEDPQGKRARGRPTQRPAPPTPEQQRIVREWKERHYADWVDHPLPALAGKSPRQACRTRAGRERVALLLEELENLESHAEPGERFDVATLRRELELV